MVDASDSFPAQLRCRRSSKFNEIQGKRTFFRKNEKRGLSAMVRANEKIFSYLLGSAAFSVLVFYLMLEGFFWRFYNEGVKAGLGENHVYFKFLVDERAEIGFLFKASVAVILIGVLAFGLWIRNKRVKVVIAVKLPKAPKAAKIAKTFKKAS